MKNYFDEQINLIDVGIKGRDFNYPISLCIHGTYFKLFQMASQLKVLIPFAVDDFIVIYRFLKYSGSTNMSHVKQFRFFIFADT